MHGFACKSVDNDPNVAYEGALKNRGSLPVKVACPLTTAWGGGFDWAAQLVYVEVHFLSTSPGSAFSCTMYRQNTGGFVLEKKTQVGFDWIYSNTEKIVTFGSPYNMDPNVHYVGPPLNPAFSRDVNNWSHEYVIECLLPGNSSLLNVNFQTIAVKKP